MNQKPSVYNWKMLIPGILLLLCATGAWAAISGKIAGKVTDAGNGDPVPGVNITVVGTSLGAASDLNGDFVILNVPPGTYEVRASFIGYATVNVTEVRVRIDLTTNLDVRLQEQAIEGEAVTVVATRPVVELDNTASKEVMSAAQIRQSWISNVAEAVTIQSGVNVNGGVRGGFGLDMYYNIDGQTIRDEGSNKSFAPISTTAIQELEVLTGGFNAEYGQANSSVVNVVTKSAGERFHGSFKTRFRPAGKYHWGGNLYSQDRWEYQQFDQAGNPAPGNPDFWDPSKGGKNGGVEPFISMTPQERLQAWQDIIQTEKVLTDYADRSQWEFDGTVTGPIVEKLGFMLAGRYKRTVLAFPSALEYHPEWSVQAKLNYDLGPQTKILVSGMHQGTDNAGAYVLPYGGSSETGGFGSGNPSAYYTDAYNPGKYWAFGAYGFGGGTGLGRVKPPEYIRQWSGQAKLTHLFNSASFVEVAYNFQTTDADRNFDDVAKVGLDNTGKNEPYVWRDGIVLAGQAMGNGYFSEWGQPAGRLISANEFWQHAFRADFTSQLGSAHQFKTGAKFAYSRYYNFAFGADTDAGGRRSEWSDESVGPLPYANPWEFALYTQDKIEIRGMVVNVGLRLDMFNANKTVGSSIWDPYNLSQFTLGHGDAASGFIQMDRNSRYSEETPTHMRLSPRIGISHPITDNTVLHFMYGHFNQRPSWTKMIANGTVSFTDGNMAYSTRPDFNFDPNFLPVSYQSNDMRFSNPWLGFERIIQYEIGFDQNIGDVLRLDATLYIKDGTGLTTAGIQTGGRDDAGTLGTSAGPTWTAPRGLPDQTAIEGNELYVPINGRTVETRGVELTFDTRFSRQLRGSLVWNSSFSTTDSYGPGTMYIEIPGEEKRGNDTWTGGNNGDGGTSGNNNERWNPNQTVKLNLLYSTPADFSPLLREWTLNWYSQWASGQLYTYHSPGDFSTETNNLRWEPRFITNVRLARMVRFSNVNFELSLDVINLFNQNQLRLFGGAEMQQYQEEDKLPQHPTTAEPRGWDWYYLQQLPRQIFFGLGVEF
jgi:hypothetical protein